MRFVLNTGMGDVTHWAPLAQAAEAAGFSTLGVADSLFYPQTSDSKYLYTESGDRSFLENMPWLDPFVGMGAVLAATKTLRTYPGVYKLPSRHPLSVAKMLSSLAYLYDGRVAFGVGSSPWKEDLTFMGLEWEGRGRRMDECIAILRGVLKGGYFGFEGEFYRFGPLKMQPLPKQPVPIIIGGHSDPALKRAAKSGDGWVSANSSLDELTALVPKLNAYRAEYGTLNRDFEIHGYDIAMNDLDGARRLADLGITDAITIPWDLFGAEPKLSEKIDAIRRFGDTVIARFK